MVKRPIVASVLLTVCAGQSAAAGKAVSCAGFALEGGAQLACSHIAPKAPVQLCTYSWSLETTAGSQQTVEGSFQLPPGAKNVTVYQGTGFTSAYSNPIVLCRGRKDR